MTIKDLREILVHFQDREYDNFEVKLWDYKNQREFDWGGSYSFSKPDKKLSFPIWIKKKKGE